MNKSVKLFCAVLLVLGAALVVTDGAMTFFGAPRKIQYSLNYFYFVILMSVCICGILNNKEEEEPHGTK